MNKYSFQKKKAKYNNTKTTIDGITFDSKFEASRYKELKLLVRAKVISDLQRQIKFEIIPKQKTELACVYIADFVYLEGKQLVIEDTKSKATMTDAYIIKRKLVKKIYSNYEFREIVK